jgi:hypothetical protein
MQTHAKWLSPSEKRPSNALGCAVPRKRLNQAASTCEAQAYTSQSQVHCARGSAGYAAKHRCTRATGRALSSKCSSQKGVHVQRSDRTTSGDVRPAASAIALVGVPVMSASYDAASLVVLTTPAALLWDAGCAPAV